MSSTQTMIRPAGPADTEAITRLATQLGYPASAQETGERLAAVLAQTEHAVFVAEVPGSGVAGWVHVFGTLPLTDAPFAELGGLIVDQAHRALGIGRALVAAAEGWARQQGYAAVRVRSNTLRAGAHAFYQTLGYERTKTQSVFACDLAQAGSDQAAGRKGR
jgi:GNAT superfamily N-acetyltransferase